MCRFMEVHEAQTERETYGYETQRQSKIGQGGRLLSLRLFETRPSEGARGVHRRVIQRLAALVDAAEICRGRQLDRGIDASAGTLRVPLRCGRTVGGRPGSERHGSQPFWWTERGLGSSSRLNGLHFEVQPSNAR